MSALGQYVRLVSMGLRQNRDDIAFMAVIQLALTFGFVLGFGYFINDVSEQQALYLTTGTATNTLVTMTLVGLPQTLSQSRARGRLDYMLALPISRELFLAAQLTFTALVTVPGIVFAVVFGTWHYDLTLDIEPGIVLVVPLVIASISGVGIALGVLSPSPNLTNGISNMLIFYILLFAPILIPAEQLPAVLRAIGTVMPTTYAADAIRGSLTNLPDTHLARSTVVLVGFAVVSLAATSASIRRRE
jgi:ABC-2 type transport system permease protein